jgi:hypothetical protein
MSPWELNLRVLRNQYPALAAELAAAAPGDRAGKEAPPEEALIQSAASGDPTMIIRGRYIHSPRDPAREGRRAAEALSGGGPLIALGFGLGYAPEAAARGGERPLIIVERRPALLRKALETRDLGDFLGKSRLIFVLGHGDGEAAGDAVLEALRLLENGAAGGGKPEWLRNRTLVELDEPWYAGVERRVQTWAAKDEVNTATLRRFGKRWVRNLARNMEAIRDLPGISRLAGLLGGEIPALLAAAGPSLDKIVPLLPAMAERCLVVAVDTSLRLLLEAGVDPDFVVAVDPQYWNSRHLDRAAAPKTRLIAESAVYPPVLRLPFAGAFLCGSLFPLGRFIEDRLDPKGELGAGGSVATSAWDFIRVLGASPVWIAGLDLSFPGLKTHFKGALFEERALAEADRLNPGETRSVRALRDGLPFRAPAADGTQVLTDRRLSLYAAWFENAFRRAPAPLNLSLSPEGLAIPGLRSALPEELLALPPRREEIRSRLAEAFRGIAEDFNRPAAREARRRGYEEARSALLSGLAEIKALAEDAAALAEGALDAENRGGGAPNREGLLSRLDEANRRIAGSRVKETAGFLFPRPEELEAELIAPETEPYKRYLELSAKTYRALAEAAGYNLAALNRGGKTAPQDSKRKSR